MAPVSQKMFAVIDELSPEECGPMHDGCHAVQRCVSSLLVHKQSQMQRRLPRHDSGHISVYSSVFSSVSSIVNSSAYSSIYGDMCSNAVTMPYTVSVQAEAHSTCLYMGPTFLGSTHHTLCTKPTATSLPPATECTHRCQLNPV